MNKFFTLIPALILLNNAFAGTSCNSCPGLIFKENKGQWEKNILYKAEIKNGAIFFEKNAITFNLVDTRDIMRIKGDHHKLENYTPAIDYTMHFHAFRMNFVNANNEVSTKGSLPIKEYFNYFIGNDKSKWASKVQGFGEFDYSNLYDGIDLKISSKDNSLKYIYELAAGFDASKLLINFDGADGIAIDEKDNLQIRTSVGDLLDLKPYAFQIVDGRETEIPCKFRLSKNSLTYFFPNGYDKSRKLFIDPTMIFSTYSGSTADNFGYSATYDSYGNAFAAGSVFGIGYPGTVGAYDITYNGGPTIFFTTGGSYPGDDISITKYTGDGTQRIFSTYLGGFGQDLPHSLIANSKDELYILGTTDCLNYPTTLTAYDTTFAGGTDPGVFDGIAAHYRHGSDIVISRLSTDGSQLLASTYVGGAGNDGLNYRAGQPYSAPGFLRHNYADEVRGEIEIDKNNNIYVASCTNSTDFPRTSGTFQSAFGGDMDACIFKMDANLTTMVWSTTFGGADDDAAYSVSVDGDENLFVAGGTRSTDFPVTTGVIQPTFAGGLADGFIVHVDKNGQSKIASTYYGYGDYDQIYFVELDKANNVYVLGQADSAQSNYIKNAVYNKPNGGEFISKFKEALDSIEWSTSFGRGLAVTDISPTAFLVDVCNNVYACGWGSQGVNNIVGGTGGTTGLDVTSNAYKATTDGQDFYLMVMKDDASALTYATFMGGGVSEEHVDGGTSRFDRKGVVYESVCAGCGSNDDFPTTPGVVSTTNNSNNCNNAIFKFDLNLPICLADFSSPTACRNLPVAFSNLSTTVSASTYKWIYGDGDSSTLTNPVHTFAQSGLFNVTLIVTDPGSCNGADTITKKILVIGGSGSGTLPTQEVCNGQSVQIGIPPNTDSNIVYHWTPSGTLSSANVSNPIATPFETTTYQLLVLNGICVDTFRQTVSVTADNLLMNVSNVLCKGDTVVLSVASSTGNSYISYTWTPADLIIAGANTANPLTVPLTDTTFYVTVETAQHCFFRDSVRIIFPAISAVVKADFIAPPAGCIPDTVQFVNTSTAEPGATYEWRFGDGTTSVQANPTHIYNESNIFPVSLIVRDNNSCNKVDSVTKQVIFLSDTSYSRTEITICFSDTAQIGFINGDPSLTYVWHPGTTLSDSTASNPLAFPEDSTTYTLFISNGICSDTIVQRVNVYRDTINAIGDTIICAGTTAQLHVNNVLNGLPVHYNWSPDENILSGDLTDSPYVFANTTTWFTVIGENALHCRYVDSTLVRVFSTQPNVTASANPDTITYGETSQLMADSSNATTLMWQSDTTLSAVDIVNPIASPRENHFYIVEVHDEHGCGKRDTVWLFVRQSPCAESNVYVPNAFSPTNDGKNDVLRVRSNNLTSLYFAVYDRWGQKMFETKDAAVGWDGNFKGRRLDPAVFGYYLEGVCEGGDKFFKKGNVTLLR